MVRSAVFTFHYRYRERAFFCALHNAFFTRSSGLNVPLPIASEIHALAALHRQSSYAAHLIAIRDAAVILPP
jgi:hypothetical protein